MNKRQQKAHWRYSTIRKNRKGPDDEAVKQLAAMPVGCFTEMIPDDHTGTKKRWELFLAAPDNASRYRNCLGLKGVIMSYGVLRWKDGRHRLTIADWVNLRHVLERMLINYWIGVPRDWGARPPAVQKRLQEAIERNQ